MKPFVYSGYYVGEGVSSPIINEYESRQNPNMIHINNTWDYATYFRYFLQRAESLIILTVCLKIGQKIISILFCF